MFHFAWADAEDTTFGPEHEVEDLDVVGFELVHKEGGFAMLSIAVKNPRVGLLADGRKQWLWFSYDDGSTDGATPLFFGRLIGVPEDVQNNAVTLNFIARPIDYDATKVVLAGSLKVQPYWDPMWLREDRRNDPDAVLEGYTLAWHIDRVTHAVTVSDILNGEDGLIDFGSTHDKDTLDIAPGEPPLRFVTIDAEIQWDQIATGVVDLSAELIAAFKLAGTTKSYAITSFTGEGLMRDWPEEGDRIGGGWEFGPCSVKRTDGFVVPQEWQQVVMTNATAQFPLWTMKPLLQVRYDVTRRRAEMVSFTLQADCQAILTEPGDEEILTIRVSGDADDPCDPADTDHPNGTMPIGDVRNRAYLPTERGRRSLEYLVCLARGAILERSRAVEISFSVPFIDGLALSCRKNARIADPRIPGGEATGKIVGYSLTGQDGLFLATVTIGCTVGKGNTIATVSGSPVYVEEGYVEAGYQLYSGQTFMPVAGEVTYEEFGHIQPNDDGIDFLTIDAAMALEQLTVFNGESAQRAVLSEFKSDIAHAVEALNEVYTEVDGDLKNLRGGPFVTTYTIVVSALQVPKTIDLEAAA